MKRLALLACALFAAACSESTAPPVATSIILSSSTVSFDAIGATQTITATVNDQRGQPMPGAPIVWTSSSPAVSVTATTATTTALAVLNGTAVITATAGSAKATLDATVSQQPAALQKVSGDAQTGPVDQPLAQLITVRVIDRLGAPVASQPVTFTVTLGGGNVAQSTITTTADGVAATSWRLGKVAAQEQTLRISSGSLPSLTVAATSVAGAPATVAVRTGDKQVGVVGGPLAFNPEVIVFDAFGNPVPNTVVTFTATGSTVAKPSATTDAAGIASAGLWTLNSTSGAKTLTASVNGIAAASFTSTALAGPAADMTLSGNGQSALVGATVPIPPSARVSDAFGNGVPGIAVTFAATSGGGSLTGATTTTDANGVATVGGWRLGSTGGTNVLTATAPSVSLSRTVTATATSVSSVGLMSITAGGNQAAMAGSPVSVAPSVTLHDASGNLAVGVPVTFAVTLGGGSITGATVTTNASGVATLGSWTLGATAALNMVTASAVGYPAVTFKGAGCEGGGAGYSITVCYRTTMSASQRQTFLDAAAKWRSVITSDLPDSPASIPQGSCDSGSPSLNMTIDDLVIFAGVEPIDGAGNVLGAAGWCFRRTNGLPVVGTMRFDEADVASLELSGRLAAVILHEMGHVIGVGTMWPVKGLLQNPSNSAVKADTYFSGVAGIAGFDAMGGATYTGGLKVPVENTGGTGTINAHWRESVLLNELMTGFLNGGSNPLSLVTVRSLEDIGYTVNTAAADPFSLTLALRALNAGDAGSLTLMGDVYQGPQSTIDGQGRITRIRP